MFLLWAGVLIAVASLAIRPTEGCRLVLLKKGDSAGAFSRQSSSVNFFGPLIGTFSSFGFLQTGLISEVYSRHINF